MISPRKFRRVTLLLEKWIGSMTWRSLLGIYFTWKEPDYTPKKIKSYRYFNPINHLANHHSSTLLTSKITTIHHYSSPLSTISHGDVHHKPPKKSHPRADLGRGYGSAEPSIKIEATASACHFSYNELGFRAKEWQGAEG